MRDNLRGDGLGFQALGEPIAILPYMNRLVRTAFRWLLPLPVLAISIAVAMAMLLSSIIIDRPFLALAARLGVNTSPPLLLGPLHMLVTLVTALVLVVPFALVAALPLRARLMDCLPCGVSVAILLVAAFVWFAPAHGYKSASRWAASGAVVVVIGGGLIAAIVSRPQRRQAFTNLFAISILFVPALSGLAHYVKYPSTPTRLWSAALQKQERQSMNTGSEYSATRQLVFTGERLVVVFDTGQTTYAHPAQTGGVENWPITTYALVSLDRLTGTIKNELQITGRWGSMPYIYANSGDRIEVQSVPPRLLNPDLTLSDGDLVGDTVTRGGSIPAGPKCVLFPQKPVSEPTLHAGCTTIQLADATGKVVSYLPVLDGYGRYAGISKDGSRFALETYDDEGDPAFLLYEHFTIYDGHSGAALAMIPIKDLPERQSWSAFSPDGKYFAVGNPNELSVYNIP